MCVYIGFVSVCHTFLLLTFTLITRVRTLGLLFVPANNKTEKKNNIHKSFCIVPSFLLNSPFCHTNYSPVVYNVFSFAGKEASFPGS